ncbi:MAG: DegV family protein, partial [Firmicutes bacterium]|nr:DegV family protein [Bacillota bacterium]
ANMTEITAEDFYRRLAVSEELPTSSQPSLGDFVRAYRKAAEDADEILCLMITSQMSGCYGTALTAAQMVKRQGMKTRVHVFDTGQCSHGMAQMVRAAAEMADSGQMTALEIMEQLTLLQIRMGVYLVLESLDNASRGGRIGAITAKTVGMLGIKPILVFRDGLVRESGIAWNYENGLNKVVEKFQEEGDWTMPVTVFHAGAPERAELLKEKILERVPEAEIRVEPVGPVIGIYTGIGCAGIAFTRKERICRA